MKIKKMTAALAAFAAAVTLSGCAAAADNEGAENLPPEILEEENITPPEVSAPESTPVQPAEKKITYFKVTADGVNIRSGAGSGYSSYGSAEKDTLYQYLGGEGGWYQTYYRGKTAYISAKYSVIVEMPAAADESVEKAIEVGAMYLGTPYVYGAVRLHDGSGKLLNGFSTNAFDCSSLMQYMFYKGAGVNLQVNTRTQVFQGTTVSRKNLKRGDLMFFTNASRKNKTGVERIGHVAMYLGDNLILHTASDYAKIENISSTRWSYFIQAQRI